MKILGWLFVAAMAATGALLTLAMYWGQYGYIFIHVPMIIFQAYMADFCFSNSRDYLGRRG